MFLIGVMPELAFDACNVESSKASGSVKKDQIIHAFFEGKYRRFELSTTKRLCGTNYNNFSDVCSSTMWGDCILAWHGNVRDETMTLTLESSRFRINHHIQTTKSILITTKEFTTVFTFTKILSTYRSSCTSVRSAEQNYMGEQPISAQNPWPSIYSRPRECPIWW